MPQVLDPGGITAPLPLSVTVILPSPLRDRVGCHTPFDFGATYPFTFVTAYCLPVYASQCLFPSYRDGPPTVQNSVPGCWLNFAGVTISVTRLCAPHGAPLNCDPTSLIFSSYPIVYLPSSTVIGSAFQILLQYSLMERSDENFPIRATFRIAIRVHLA